MLTFPLYSPHPLSATSYHVSVKTGDVWGGGTDANVFIKLFGSKGDSGQLQLKSADNTKNKFERDRTDQFKLETSDIGKVYNVKTFDLTFDINKGSGSIAFLRLSFIFAFCFSCKLLSFIYRSRRSALDTTVQPQAQDGFWTRCESTFPPKGSSTYLRAIAGWTRRRKTDSWRSNWSHQMCAREQRVSDIMTLNIFWERCTPGALFITCLAFSVYL